MSLQFARTPEGEAFAREGLLALFLEFSHAAFNTYAICDDEGHIIQSEWEDAALQVMEDWSHKYSDFCADLIRTDLAASKARRG
jgi:hypothetical protein